MQIEHRMDPVAPKERSSDDEKPVVELPQASHEEIHKETAQAAAERGRAATDKYGNALVYFDPAEERRLRWKIDLYIIPSVSLLYLFCFIDRANIGRSNPARN